MGSALEPQRFEEGTSVSDAVRSWRGALEQGGKRVFALVGPPGIGKTSHLERLCSECRAKDPQKRVVDAHFFFSFGDPQLSRVKTCLLSIAEQLELDVPEDILNNVEDEKVLFRMILCKPLQERCVSREAGQSVLVVLDGLDEAVERDAMIEIATEMWEKEMPNRVGLLFSCRPILVNSDVVVYQMAYDSEVIRKDIQVFAHSNIDGFGFSAPRESEEAVRFICKSSAGYFVYASRLVQRTLSMKNEAWTLFKFADFVVENPRICDVVFKSYCDRLLHCCFESDRELYDRFLSALAVSRSGLDRRTLDLLFEGSKKCTEDVLRIAREMLFVDKEGHVRFPHKSMRSFLLDRRRAGKELFVSEKGGHKMMIDTLMQDKTCPTSLRNLAYHACAAEDWEDLRQLVLDFEWLYALVSLEGAVQQVIGDLDGYYLNRGPVDRDVAEVVRVLELGLEGLRNCPDQLASELFGRLENRNNPIFESFFSSQFACDGVEGNDLPRALTFCKVLRKDCAACALHGCILAFGASAGMNTVHVVNWRTGESLHVIEAFDWAVAIDDDVVATVSPDFISVRLWDLRTGINIQVLSVSDVDLLALDGKFIALGINNDDGSYVEVWNWREGELLSVHELSYVVTSVAINGEVVVAGEKNYSAKVCNWQTSQCLYDFPESGGSCVAIDGDIVVLSNGKCFNWRSGEEFNFLGNIHPSSVVAIDGDLVVVGEFPRKTLTVWSWRTGECLHVLDEGHSEGFCGVLIKGNTVISKGWDETIRIWDLSEISR